MTRFVAFLRAVNIGGRTIKMEQLRRSLEALGLTRVETFIASGNVAFDSSKAREEALRKRIEAKLKEDFGFEVPTFLRTDAELNAIARFEAFSPSKFREPESRLFVAFLMAPLPPDAERALTQQSSAVDEFRVHGREIYWLCHVRWSDSDFSGAKLEKTVGTATTVRNINTVRRMAEKLAGS